MLGWRRCIRTGRHRSTVRSRSVCRSRTSPPDTRCPPPRLARPRRSTVAGRSDARSGVRTMAKRRVRPLTHKAHRPSDKLERSFRPRRARGRCWSRPQSQSRADEHVSVPRALRYSTPRSTSDCRSRCSVRRFTPGHSDSRSSTRNSGCSRSRPTASAWRAFKLCSRAITSRRMMRSPSAFTSLS